jgi:hypothetical protein
MEAVLSSARTYHSELSTVIDTLLASIESNRQRTLESASQERSDHIAMSTKDIKLSTIVSFLHRYGPLQLLCDRRKASKRLHLAKRLLSTCTLLQTACNLVNQVDRNDNGEVDMSRLAAALAVDKKCTLPHPMWTSRHDAVLIHAISKHGWIDHDGSCRAITNDPTVRWGAPFDASASENVLDTTVITPELLETANRAAIFLNAHHNSIEEIKGFNLHLVVRTYGMIRQDDSDQSQASQKWTVDSTKLQLSRHSDGANDQGLAELPTKKDLVKRAKIVLSRTPSAVGNLEEKTLVKPSYGFAVLDQSERCNVLLAEIMRGILKTPGSSSKDLKDLCASAVQEARKRVDATEIRKDSTAGNEGSGTKSDLLRVLEHVELLKYNLSKGMTQSKNLVRVMLGEDPVKPKNPNDPLFPKAKPASLSFRPTKPLVAKKSPSKATPRNALRARPTGDTAIDSARKRMKETYGDPAKLASLDNDTSLLELTEIETLILSSLCADGMPVWDPNFQTAMNVSNISARDTVHTWGDLGRLLAKNARDELAKASKRLEQAKEVQGNVATDSKGDPDCNRTGLMTLLGIESDVVKKEDVVAQADEYASEPETLAKKVVMLVAKIRQHCGPTTVGAYTVRAYHGLGTKTLAWQDKETSRWAGSLDLLDNGGQPLGFTAVDFMYDVPDEDRSKIQISSILDKKGSRQILAQISMITRLRAITKSYNRKDLDRKIEKAVKNILDGGDIWENQPQWWLSVTSSGNATVYQSDKTLLCQLMEMGLTDELLEVTLTSGKEDKVSTFACTLESLFTACTHEELICFLLISVKRLARPVQA